MSETEGSRTSEPSPKQIWLLNFKNPMKDRLGEEFFKKIPKSPGVYWMLGQSQEVLYVGKAKNLQNRLKSYPRVKPEQSSRKIMQLVYLVKEVRWEVCESEESALLRENYLLRTLQPPFNWMNTHPENYLTIGFTERSNGEGSEFDFQLTGSEHIPDFEYFGAFKSRGRVQRSFASLLRLIWWAVSPPSVFQSNGRFLMPGVLVRRKVPYRYTVAVDPEWDEKHRRKLKGLLRRYLRGTSPRLLKELSCQLLDKEGIPPFLYHFIQEDLESLKEFYEFGPRKNWRLSKHHGLPAPFFAQEELDDFLVKYRLSLK